MNAFGALILIAILAGGGYFTWWAIQRTLNEDKYKDRRTRRQAKKR
jgi:ABC-type microcin C transport system permease subunit YejB